MCYGEKAYPIWEMQWKWDMYMKEYNTLMKKKLGELTEAEFERTKELAYLLVKLLADHVAGTGE